MHQLQLMQEYIIALSKNMNAPYLGGNRETLCQCIALRLDKHAIWLFHFTVWIAYKILYLSWTWLMGAYVNARGVYLLC